MISLEAGVAGLTAAGFVFSICGLILAFWLRFGDEIKENKIAKLLGLSSLKMEDGAVLFIAIGVSMQLGALLISHMK